MPENSFENLVLSAHSLQAYVDCHRRFELSYLQELQWPAVETEPLLESERHMDDGRRFHEMVHRDIVGMAPPAPDPTREVDVARWWANYQNHRPGDLEGSRYPEKTLVGRVDGRTLVATCDLIVVQPQGRLQIFDWKTWRRRHGREWLSERLQTKIYPFLAAQSTQLTGAQIAPGNIEMVYWYADFPDEPETFRYNEEQLQSDEAYIVGLAEEIANTDEGAFALTDDVRQCTYCIYRSFCDRGTSAGRDETAEWVQLKSEWDESATGPDGASPASEFDDYDAVAF